MKLKHILLYLPMLAVTSMSCSDNEYVSNDPDAAPNEPTCYDVNDLFRPYDIFFKPSHGWVGDPMPYYENGKFYVFYLQDARDGGATFHPWYLATTSDLVTYTDEGEAIPCGEDKSQEDALGTGSVFKHNNVYYAFYTAHNGELSPKEKIYLATSTDLKTWTKQPEFSLQASDGYDANEFRDPTIIEENGIFKMLLSSRADYKGSWRAVIAQYTSTDLLNWTLDTPFYDDPTTMMLECPDVFTMGEYQYLIYSNIDDDNRMVHYRYRKTGVEEWTIPSPSNLDSKAFYAGKTTSDGTNRYIFGWCPTRDNHKDSGSFSWGGSLVAHQLVQNADGTLYTKIPQSVSEKVSASSNLSIIASRNNQPASSSYTLSGSDNNADYVTFDRIEGLSKLTTTIKANAATNFGFEFGACGNRREVYTVTFNITEAKLQLNKELRLAGSSEIITSVPLLLADNNEYKVTLFIENSICVLYVNDQIAFTNRIYKMSDNPWRIFSNDGTVTFSDFKFFK